VTVPTVHVLGSAAALTAAVEGAFAALARATVGQAGRFVVALSGGRTPRDLYTALGARDDIPWRDTHIFWADERYVPLDHPESNYRLVRDTLLANAPIPRENVHPFPVQAEPETAAAEYERTLRALFGAADRPSFDLVLLGLGEDGHTASLFPDSPLLRETARWVGAVHVPQLGTYRLTLTPAALNAARHVWFVVSGAAKAEAVRAVLGPARDPARWPAQVVGPDHGEVTWWLDEAAAASRTVI
jgi:6-phosphogluconolactonase